MTNQQHTDPFAERIITRLKEDHIAPRPRWNFAVLNASFWTLGAVAVILGALAFAAALFEVANTDWEYYPATHADFFSFFFSVAPILWVLAIALFSYLGYENIRRTKRGYRYPLAYLVVGAIMTSIVLGAALYTAGAGEAVEEGIGDYPPFYRPLLLEERSWWQQPSQGLLAGTVGSTSPDGSNFVLKDLAGNTWTVTTSDLRGPDLAALSAGGTIRVVGVPTTASSTFHACFIFPGSVLALHQILRPTSLASSSTERLATEERSDICKGIRPYGSLRARTGQ